MGNYATDKAKLRPVDELHIALQDLDFSWYPVQVQEAKKLWKEGWGVDEIAQKVGREGDEVFLLLLDLGRKGRIKPREGGVFGYQD